jgi:hypothetical protein
MSRTSTTVSVVRHIDADPASIALLLAGPTAVELWPGARPVGSVRGRLLVATSDPEPAGAVSVTAHPPRRTPTSFVSAFSWSGPDLAVTDAELTLGYAPGGSGVPATTAHLVLVAERGETSVAPDRRHLAAMAEEFLRNLAEVAEARRAA